MSIYADVPMFPDVSIERLDGTTRVSTCTLRPPVYNGRGQIFTILITHRPGFSDEELYERGKEAMMDAFKRAHPDGCP